MQTVVSVKNADLCGSRSRAYRPWRHGDPARADVGGQRLRLLDRDVRIGDERDQLVDRVARTSPVLDQ